MKETIIKLQIENLDQRLKALKAKIVSRKENKKTLSGLYGVFEDEMDMSFEEIKTLYYTLNG